MKKPIHSGRAAPSTGAASPSAMPLTVVELFAGVGGFRLGLEPAGWQVTWSNQWEPSTRAQHASDCYAGHFTEGRHVCEDISAVLDSVEAGDGRHDIPAHTLLVGGFPCQDYSVARTLNSAHGIEGKKGVLWWEIHRLLTLRRPPFVLLENVDRLLKSPAQQRGRDFAIILRCMADLGYAVEWRVIDASDYGFPQRRRRVFLLATHSTAGSSAGDAFAFDAACALMSDGVLARAFPVEQPEAGTPSMERINLSQSAAALSERFGQGLRRSPFLKAGIMVNGEVWTTDVAPQERVMDSAAAPPVNLADVLQSHDVVDAAYFVPEDQVEAWRYLKGSKKEERVHRSSGAKYFYAEGAIPFPDPVDRPSRTILTGEGGSGPSRFKHIIDCGDGRYRRLTPVELERLNGFPDDWTAGMPDARRAFCMGNALVVGAVERIGHALGQWIAEKGLTAVAEPGGQSSDAASDDRSALREATA